jgi:hypothetical protein
MLAGRLRSVVASRTKINGRPSSASGLRREQQSIRVVLDAIITFNELHEAGEDLAAASEVVEKLLEERLSSLRKREHLRPGIDAGLDRLRMLSLPDHNDLGSINTQHLFDLFSEYPVSSLRRCKLETCGRYFIPGAEGRKRTRRVLYCSDACKRGWTNAKRRSG